MDGGVSLLDTQIKHCCYVQRCGAGFFDSGFEWIELGGNRIFKDVTTYLDAALTSRGRGNP
jgi:hypothetical protein